MLIFYIMSGPSDTQPTPPERVRLHITPFNPELLDRILVPSVKPLATNISFHNVQTFPERGFGYLELPIMEAQKLKKKLNGSTLKGAKVRIEDAKPEKKRKAEASDGPDSERKARKVARREQKVREDGVLAGHELEAGRHVKRGWKDATEGGRANAQKSKKTRTASEHDAVGQSLAAKKLRFKTSVPPNVSALPNESKSKDKAKKKARKETKNDRRTVVDEFKKTTKIGHGHARTDDSRGPLRYEDGKGWVNEAGEIVEGNRPSKKSKGREEVAEAEKSPVSTHNAQHEDSQVRGDAMELDNVSSAEMPAATPDLDVNEERNIVETSSIAQEAGVAGAGPAEEAVPAEAEKEVHPLEALFKRPAPVSPQGKRGRPKPIDTSFNFFDADVDDDGDENIPVDMPPQTPHTRRDLEWRSIRSAAPTPDTAAIGRKFSFPFAQQNDSVDEPAAEESDAEEVEAESKAGAAAAAGKDDRGEESAYRKWFYENRGDYNRGWKKRRREERKVKRQRENRRLSRKIV